MRVRKRLKRFDELTPKDIETIHQLMRQGVIVKSILKQIHISQITLNKLFERNMFGKKIINQKQKQNGSTKN
jgi:hypothetical protein